MAARKSLSFGLALLCSACAVAIGPPPPRASQLAGTGDPRFRASQDLVLEGLEADGRGQTERARSRFERALQVDSSNPWAYLALARHHLDAGRAGRARQHAERAAVLFESLDPPTPGALVHCDGLRGAALALEGRDAEARPLLDAAARSAPAIWGDAHLSPDELR